MPDEEVAEQQPVIVDKPNEACTYIQNPDGTFTRVDAPTIVPDFVSSKE